MNGNYRNSPSYKLSRPFIEGWLRVGILAPGLLCEEQASVSRENTPFIAPNKQTKTTMYTREGLKMEFD